MDKIEPLYYLVGFLVVTNIGSLITRYLDSEKAQESETSKDIKELTASVIELKTKMDIFSKDLNNIGKKLRGG